MLLSLTVSDLGFLLLSGFHLLAVIFFLVYKAMWAQENGIIEPGCVLINVSLMKTHWLPCCNGASLVHLSIKGERKYTHWITVILRHIRFKAGLVHSSSHFAGL
jgi:hypothetical protein